jgi:transcriptional regulator with XRE-family HTH domain
MKYFSNNLVFLRKSAKKTQQEVAFDLKFSGSSRYSNYEKSSSKPDLDTLIALSKYFKVTIDDLLNKDLGSKKYPETPENTMSMKESVVSYNEKNKLPLIPITAVAGFANGIDNPVLAEDCEYYSVPEFNKKADYLIRINGSSMYPKYNSGDIVACKKLPKDTFFQWNKTYVLDTIQGALVKRITPSERPDYVRLVSDNVSYPPFDIHINEIHSLSLVVGVIRFE